jgi:Domain of unknown function (DUF4345)
MARFYLLFSAAGLTVVALSYGIAPAQVLPAMLDLSVEGTDLTHIFRALTGLYLGMVILWVCGAFRPGLLLPAVIAEVTFMFGLTLGRMISMVVDGMPSPLLALYAILELGMGLWGVLIWKRLAKET